MIINNINLKKNTNGTKLSATVLFNSGKTSEVFFTADNKHSKFIKVSADPFLACLMLPAMKLGEDIIIEGSISPKLLSNTQKIMKVTTDWNMGLKKINITPESVKKDKGKFNKIGSFFSGGVDSFTTYLRNKSVSKQKINYLLFVHGFDIFLKDDKTFKEVIKNIKAIANREKVELLIVKTNLRETIDPILGWGYSHGGALAAVALFLSDGFSEIFIPSSYSTGQFFPWGSHPELDYLWSTENLKIVHDSSDLSRQKKINDYISKSAVALDYLRVCWSNYEYNCGRCNKCIRTMFALYISNSLDKSKTFPKEINIKYIKNLDISSRSEMVFFEEILFELKKENRDQEMQKALEYAFIRSKNPDIKKKVRNIVGFLDKKFNKERLFWFLAKKGMTRL